MTKRISALLLSVVLCLGLLSTTAFAADKTAEFGDDGYVEGVLGTTRVIWKNEVMGLFTTHDYHFFRGATVYILSLLDKGGEVKVDGEEGYIFLTKRPRLPLPVTPWGGTKPRITPSSRAKTAPALSVIPSA